MLIEFCFWLHILFGYWGLGLVDWPLGIRPNPQSPIPNPQSPIPIKLFNYKNPNPNKIKKYINFN